MKFRSHALSRAVALAALGACASGAVLAQSSVNIGGYFDIGVYRDGNTKATQVGSIQRSNIAFSGREDLGGGNSAIFRLSTRFDPNTGALEGAGPNPKPMFHDEATLGVKGGFGTFKMGRALDAMYSQDWQFDPWGYFDRVASPAWDLWHYNFPSDPKGNTGGPDYGRLNNGLFYDSPAFGGGFAVHLSGTAATAAGDANRALGGSLTYSQGPVSAMLARERNSAGNTDTFVGLKGTVSGVTLMGAYDNSKAGTSNAKTITLGAQYTVGLTTFKGGWGQVKVNDVRAQRNLGLGVSYALSKRTSVYADLSRKNRPTTGDMTGVGVGIAHSF